MIRFIWELFESVSQTLCKDEYFYDNNWKEIQFFLSLIISLYHDFIHFQRAIELLKPIGKENGYFIQNKIPISISSIPFFSNVHRC